MAAESCKGAPQLREGSHRFIRFPWLVKRMSAGPWTSRASRPSLRRAISCDDCATKESQTMRITFKRAAFQFAAVSSLLAGSVSASERVPGYTTARFSPTTFQQVVATEGPSNIQLTSCCTDASCSCDAADDCAAPGCDPCSVCNGLTSCDACGACVTLAVGATRATDAVVGSVWAWETSCLVCWNTAIAVSRTSSAR